MSWRRKADALARLAVLSGGMAWGCARGGFRGLGDAAPPTELDPCANATAPAAAADVAEGRVFWACDGAEITGTMPAPTGPTGPTGPSMGGTAVASDILAGKTAWVDGIELTGTMPTGALSAASLAVGAGYYDATSLDAIEADLAGPNFCAGVDLFGVPGAASCVGAAGTGTSATANDLCLGTYAFDASGVAQNGLRDCSGGSGTGSFDAFMGAGVYRNRGAAQSTIADEYTTFSTNSAGYRAIPDVAVDDDAWSGTSVTKATHAGPTCGLAGTIAARITDCGFVWDGAVNGTSSEGLWELVTRTALGHEVWRDARTRLLWSDNVGSINWCKASGNAQNASAIDCSGALGGQSACTDDAAFPDFKGNLLAAQNVKWRLPSMSDLKLADVDGFRFVLPNLGWFWSTTIRSDGRNQALLYNGWQGYINFANRDANQNAVCVGVWQ